MAAQVGRNFLLKVGVGGSPVTVAGMRTTSLSVNGDTVDTTNKDSNGVRELLAGAGVSSMSISASGILSASAQATTFITAVLARTIDAYTLLFDNDDKIEGNWQCVSFDASGEYNGEQTYSLQLQSSGTLTTTWAA